MKPAPIPTRSVRLLFCCYRVKSLGVGLCLCLVLAGCGERINQRIKNETFSLGYALGSTSANFDRVERQLLVAKTTVRRNLEQMQDVQAAQGDSLYSATVDSLVNLYQDQQKVFDDLWQENKAFQEEYIEVHTAFNAFQNQVEDDALSDQQAAGELENYKRRHEALERKLEWLRPQVQEAIANHNNKIEAYAQSARAYNLNRIPEVKM